MLPGGTLPLNVDALFDLSLALANSTVFTRNIGVLNAQGTADLALDLRGQALGPTLIGLDLTAAAWILQGSGLQGRPSNPVDIRFTR